MGKSAFGISRRSAFLRRSTAALCLLWAMASAAADKIAVLGDVHGEISAVREIMGRARADGITDVVLTGDLVGFPEHAALHQQWKTETDPAQKLALQKQLRKVAQDQVETILQVIEEAGYSGPHLVAVPGNWEKYWVPNFGEIAEDRAIVPTYSYDGKGIARIGGQKVMVGHVPRIPVPEKYIMHNGVIDDSLENMMSPLGYPSEKVDLIFFGHTHIRAAYFDPRAQAWVVNPGGVTDKRRVDSPSFAIVEPGNEIRFVEVSGKKVGAIPMRAPAAVDGCVKGFEGL